MAESLRYKFEEHWTCSVCLEPFKDPKVLPCLHSYCHVCIVNLAKNANSKTINCPECRLAVEVRIIAWFIHKVALLPNATYLIVLLCLTPDDFTHL
jgi:hypothetical protein